MSGAILMLDGPDAAGKTTFAERVKEYVGEDNYAYEHLTYLKGTYEMWKWNYDSLLRAIASLRQGKVHIIDRGWMSENIYSMVYRGGSKMPYDVRGFDRLMRRFGGCYVMCCPPAEFAMANHAKTQHERPEMYEQDDRLRKVAQMFRDLAMGSHDYIRSDYVTHCMSGFHRRTDFSIWDISPGAFDTTSDCALRNVVAKARARAAFARDEIEGLDGFDNLVGYIGEAKVLLVGDRCNPNKKGTYSFVDFGASSRTLNKIIHELHVDDTELAFINANDAQTHVKGMCPNDLAQRVDLTKLKVIALGNEASKTLSFHGIHHFKAQHPSFSRRFNQTDLLKAQLAEIFQHNG